MRKYSRLIIIGMSIVSIQIVIMSISSILRIAAFGSIYEVIAYAIMLLFFVFANIFIICKFITTISKELDCKERDSSTNPFYIKIRIGE